MAVDSPLERLRNVLGGTARALSGEAEAELSFTSEAPRQDGRSNGQGGAARERVSCDLTVRTAVLAHESTGAVAFGSETWRANRRLP